MADGFIDVENANEPVVTNEEAAIAGPVISVEWVEGILVPLLLELSRRGVGILYDSSIIPLNRGT